MIRGAGGLIRDTLTEWLEDEIPERGAALSYYVILSLGPFLVIVVGALELLLSGATVRENLLTALEANAGARLATTVATVMERTEPPSMLGPGALLTVALLLFAATAAFANVRNALNRIWGVEVAGGSTWAVVRASLRTRAVSFLMILLTGLVMALSFVITSGVGILSRVFDERVPHGWVAVRALDAGLSVLLTGLLFAAIYRTLPAIRIRWQTVWVGAFATALIFVVGKSAVAWVIASAAWASYYGPGASVVAFLAWIYFSAQLFYLGAEFTQVWARRRGEVLGLRRGTASTSTEY